MKIEIIDLKNYIEFNGKYKNDWGLEKEFDSFKITNVSKRGMVSITVYRNKIPLTSFKKKLKFENKVVTIIFNKNVVEIGNYKMIED